MSRVLYRIVGMSRSGNHAIINWILSQLRGSWCFLNCVEPKADPLATARPMDDGRRILTDAGSCRDGEAVGAHLLKDHVILSQEDTFLGPAFGPRTTALQRAACGEPERQREILILRDPYNLMASRRHLTSTEISEQTAMRIWKQHACWFDAEAEKQNLVAVNYNLWVADSDYRRRLSRRLGLPFSDTARLSVPNCAGGSSFDGVALNGRAHEMAVFDRWQSCANDPSYWNLFDRRAQELCERIYGFARPYRP